MTFDNIRDRLKKIKESSGDSEVAHGMEDDLYTDFVEYVAKTSDGDLAKKAELVLTTSQIEFERWYA